MTLNPIKAIKLYFANKREDQKKRQKEWVEKLSQLGFNQLPFPIIIKWDKINIEIVMNLEEFAFDPDYYFHEFDSNMELIDSRGQLWSWKYNSTIRTNLPGKIKRTLIFDDVKKIVINHLEKRKLGQEIKNSVGKISTIDKLMKEVAEIA